MVLMDKQELERKRKLTVEMLYVVLAEIVDAGMIKDKALDTKARDALTAAEEVR
jgi:hypothetical protein